MVVVVAVVVVVVVVCVGGAPARTRTGGGGGVTRRPQEAREYAREEGIIHFETSAKTAENVKDLFYTIGVQRRGRAGGREGGGGAHAPGATQRRSCRRA